MHVLDLSARVRDFQSPLHRGRVFNNLHKSPQYQGVLDFQSPLHRGRVFNVLAADAETDETATFQSPLHRGRVFNSRGAAGRPQPALLSVPSSSGKGLQRHCREFAPIRDSRAFSPLFIGEGSSTYKLMMFTRTIYHLSVPSSSGKGLQR